MPLWLFEGNVELMIVYFQLGLSAGWIGFMFMVAPAVYALVAPLCGYISDKVSSIAICKLDSGGGAVLEHCPHRTAPLRA